MAMEAVLRNIFNAKLTRLFFITLTCRIAKIISTTARPDSHPALLVLFFLCRGY
jgi:hypothetical protein